MSVSGDLNREPAVYTTGTEAVILRPSVDVGVSYLLLFSLHSLLQIILQISENLGAFFSVMVRTDSSDVSNLGRSSCFSFRLADWHVEIHSVPFNQRSKERKVRPLPIIFFERVLIILQGIFCFHRIVEKCPSLSAMFAFGLYFESVRSKSLKFHKFFLFMIGFYKWLFCTAERF